MTFAKQVAAYLTGWCIVQPLYNRLMKYVRNRELTNPSDDTRRYFRHEAVALSAALQEFGQYIGQGPRRGDEVEAWIKRHRDRQKVGGTGTPQWDVPYKVLDDLLDAYRLHADTGMPLRVVDPGP